MTLNLDYVSTTESTELVLFIENDGEMYRGIIKPTILNLAKKYDKGLFDTELAIKAFYNIAVEGAKRYQRDFGSPSTKWYETFSVSDRNAAAMELLEGFFENINGENPIN